MNATFAAVMSHVSLVLSVALLGAAFYIKRKSNLRTAFLSLMGVMVLWNFATVVTIDAEYAAGELFMPLIGLNYVAICFAPIAVLYFGATALFPDFRPDFRHGAFLIVPFASTVMVFTNGFHKLFFVNFTLESSTAVYGPYYYFHSVYSYALIAAGIVMLVVASARMSGVVSAQMLILSIGIIVPVGANVLYSFNITELPFTVNATLFTVASFCFFLSVIRFKFLKVEPVSVRRFADLISDGYLVLDAEGTVTDCNKKFVEILPPGAEVKNRGDVCKLIRSFAGDVPAYEIDALLDRPGSDSSTRKIDIEPREGTHMELEVTPVFNRGELSAYVLLFKDVTERVKSVMAARAESRYKSEFLSMMSHELRTPINAVTGMTEIALRSGDAARMTDCLEKIDTASKHLLGIINNILDMSKMEAGEFELRPAPFDFDALIDKTETRARAGADAKRLKFTAMRGANIPKTLIGDAGRIARVINNLLDNAIKFTGDGGEVSLRVKLVSGGKQPKILVRVSDTGIGMKREQLGKIFESFTQADASDSRKFGGVGLGLALSRQIARLAGGDVTADSEPDGGSTFFFTFVAEAGDGNYVPASESAETDGFRRLDGVRILAAEDVDINREIIAAFLEDTGAEIDFAFDGKQALEMFSAARGNYDCILMDIQMPEMDGLETTRRVRASGWANSATVPVIALTANTLPDDMEACRKAGMTGYLAKPMGRDELIDAVLVRMPPL